MVLQAEPTPRQPRPSHDWHRIFESLPEEHDYVVDEIEGRLPEGLTGTLYRNGPGINEVGGKPFAHLFDGHGMISQFVLDGEARALPQPLRADAPSTSASATPSKPQVRGFGQQRPGGVLRNALPQARRRQRRQHQRHDCTATTCSRSGRAGRPWALDPDTLETRGEYDFDGELKAAYAFSAHPKYDPRDGRDVQLRRRSTGRARKIR